MENQRMLIKVVVLGDPSVGKGEILAGGFKKDRNGTEFPISYDFINKYYNVDGQDIKLQLFESRREERFLNLPRSFYLGVSGIFLVFDFSNRDTFLMCGMWMDSIRSRQENIDCFLIGNNCDKKRVVTEEEILEFKNCFNVKFYEVSGRTGLSVEKTFYDVAKTIKEHKESKTINKEEPKEQKPRQKAQQENTSKEVCGIW